MTRESALAALDTLTTALREAQEESLHNVATLNAIELLLEIRPGETGWQAINRLRAAIAKKDEALRELLEEQMTCDTDNPHVEVWCITHQQKRCHMNDIVARARRALAEPTE